MATPSPPPAATNDLPSVLSKLESARLTLQTLTSSIESFPPPSSLPYDAGNSDDDTRAVSTYPGTLCTELEHYKELFSQLRFSYLEQMTKEKFLRYVTEEPPKIHEAEENAAREAELKSAKESLQRCKKKVDETLREIDEVGARLAPAYERLLNTAKQARSLPAETATMRAEIATLRGAADDRPEMNLPLDDTLQYVGAAESELAMLQSELKSLLGVAIPRRQKQVEQLEKEIVTREREKEGLERFANEAVRARQGAREAGKADREIAGQWYKSSYEVLSALLGEEPER
ncbi:hypothetical protein BZA05DRAFT_475842 [Tricharina praecox]|uniref:uncharacterized protein n=1 Tax=Tricharina praecox TaxID=43433 RepID=UPI00221FDAFC|nr:uncharacterized protein BZA05DRAFT_475842 [Tricharina praecox]KAI5846825.1 hypothetical protein BZA05DRAFT_475842 [Tricharina praecox]